MTSEERKAARAKAERDRRAADPEGYRARARARHAANPEIRRASGRAHRAANAEKYRLRDRARALKRHGLTIPQWDALFEAQGCRCKRCGTDDPGNRRRWATDHDHATGKVRGILCNRCNITLGLLGDNAESVRTECSSYLEYLENQCAR